MENKIPKMHLDGVHFIQLESSFFSLKMLFQSLFLYKRQCPLNSIQ